MPFRIVITESLCEVMEQRFRTLKDQDTGEIIQVPIGPHAASVSLGDFTSVDEKTGVTSIDQKGYIAALQTKVTPFTGDGLASVIATAAFATEVATKIIEDAKAQAAKMLADAKPADISAVAEPLSP